jgi:hypothetical protein
MDTVRADIFHEAHAEFHNVALQPCHISVIRPDLVGRYIRPDCTARKYA